MQAVCDGCAMTQSASASLMRNSAWRPGAFSKRDTWAARASSSRRMDRGPPKLVHRNRMPDVRRRWVSYPRPCPSPAASAALPFVQDLAPVACSSRRQQPTRSQTQPPSAALSKIAPQSNCPGVDQLRNTGRSKISGKSKHSVGYVRSSEAVTFGPNPHRQRFCTMAGFRALKNHNFSRLGVHHFWSEPLE